MPIKPRPDTHAALCPTHDCEVYLEAVLHRSEAAMASTELAKKNHPDKAEQIEEIEDRFFKVFFPFFGPGGKSFVDKYENCSAIDQDSCRDSINEAIQVDKAADRLEKEMNELGIETKLPDEHPKGKKVGQGGGPIFGVKLTGTGMLVGGLIAAGIVWAVVK